MAGIEIREMIRSLILVVAFMLTIAGISMATRKWEGADEGAKFFFLTAILCLLWAQAI